MEYRKRGSAVFVMLCLVVVTANANYFEKELSFEMKRLIVAKESLVNTTLLYGVCDFHDSINPNGSCEIILENFKFDNTSEKISCQLTLKTHVKEDLQLAQVGKNKAVIVAVADFLEHSEKQYLELMTVDLASCQSVYAKIAAPPSKSNWTASSLFVTPYENTYDIHFAHDYSPDEKNWKGTFDLEGKIVKEIAPWAEVEMTPYSLQVTNAKHQSSDGGFIVMRSESEKLVAMSIKDNDKKILREWNLPIRSYSFMMFFDNNETVSECLYIIKDNDLKCSVLGSQGLVKDEISLDVAPFYFFPDVLGGYIVLYDKCLELKNAPFPVRLPCDNSKLYVKRLNAEGQLIKDLPLNTFVLDLKPERYSVHVFKNDDEETCVSYISYRNGFYSLDFPNKLNVAAQCFVDL